MNYNSLNIDRLSNDIYNPELKACVCGDENPVFTGLRQKDNRDKVSIYIIHCNTCGTSAESDKKDILVRLWNGDREEL